MPRFGFDISSARILVTNDDGIHAPGLAVLQRVARSLSRDVWVVAPEAEQSGSAHSLTLRRPLRERRLSPRRFAIDGTPTDCVLLAVNHIIPKRRPDLILSGVNRGSNLGEDVTYSGTIAAAMEGALLGVPSIALSQVQRGDGPTPWRVAEEHAGEVIRRLAGLDWPQGVLMNVNFPDPGHGPVTGVRVARQGRRVGGIAILEGRDPKNRPYVWIGDFTSDETTAPGTDLEAIYDHAIAVTPLHLDLTHDSLDLLRKAFP
jgi:5'-nucleotidase